MISKLAGLVSIGGTVANVTLFQRFLQDVTSIIALTVLSTLIGGILLASGFYGLFLSLIHFGMSSDSAVTTVLTIMIALAAGSAALAYVRVRRLRELPSQTLRTEVPVVARIESIARAFMKGYKTGHSNP